MTASHELPVIRVAGEERWDCQGCGNCCRASIIPLSEADLQKLREQRWDDDPDYCGQRQIDHVQGRERLAQRADGSCVFLTAAGRCRIHEKFGAEAKPLVCRVFPLQLIPRERHALLTLRRACPAAAADEGRALTEHLPEVQRLVASGELQIALPKLLDFEKPAWQRAGRAMAAAARILNDERFPPVRRVVHALLFARMLDQARLDKLDDAKYAALLGMLEPSVVAEAGPLFANRRPPSAMGGLLFRLIAAEYIRLHPGYRPPTGFFVRGQLLRSMLRMIRGRGQTPPLHPLFPATTFAALDEPLATVHPALIRPEIQRPLERYLATSATSYQYALANRRGWSVVQSIRALAMTFPIALYLLRWSTAGREPSLHDVAQVVAALDLGQGYSSLAGMRYRTVLSILSMQDDLERIAVWYAR